MLKTDFKITQKILTDNFSLKELEKGKNYQKKGYVHNITQSDNGLALQSIVQGKSDPFYDVDIQIAIKKIGITIEGECSCYIGYNCKHVTATLYQAIEDQKPSIAHTASNMASPNIERDKSENNFWSHFLTTSTTPDKTNKTTASQKRKQRIIYILDLIDFRGQLELNVKIYLAYILKNDNNGHLTRFSTTSIAHKTLLNKEHALVLFYLDAIKTQSNQSIMFDNDYILTGDMAETTLQHVLKTNCCHWEDKSNPILRLGRPRKTKFTWEATSTGLQHLKSTFRDASIMSLPTAPPFYLNNDKTTIGKITSDLDDATTAKLINDTPPLPPKQAKQFSTALKKNKQLSEHFPLPTVYKQSRPKKHNMIPCLSLYKGTLEIDDSSTFYPSTKTIEAPLACISFQYGSQTIPLDSDTQKDVIEFVEKDTLMRITRDHKQEIQAIKMIQDLDFFAISPPHAKHPHVNQHTFHIGHLEDTQSQLEFMFEHLPKLKANNWQIDISDDFPLECIDAEEDNWYTEIEEQTDYDWFGFELGIMIDKEKINILPLLVELIRQQPEIMTPKSIQTLPDDHKFYLTLPDKRHIVVEAKRVKKILSTLVELFNYDSLKGGQLPISRLQAGQVFDLQQNLSAKWLGGENLKTLGQKLSNFKGIQSHPIPKNFNGTLRDYQKQGFDWLHFLRDFQLGGVLADDMGLGKTVQILSLLLSIKQENSQNNNPITHKPTLIIAPTSLMTNWHNENQQFTPELNMVILQGNHRHALFEQAKTADIVLSTYPLLVRDKEFFQSQEFNYLILDEAQYIKNPKTKAYRVLMRIKSDHNLCMSGTPMENHLGELWSLFNFALPGLLGDDKTFKQLFRNPIEKDNDLSRQKVLAQRVEPFMLRRTKEEVLTELPEKTEIIHTIEIKSAQRDLYESIRLAMDKKVRGAVQSKGLSRSHIIILDALLKLRQTCNDPRLLPLEKAKSIKQSAKLDFLFDMLSNLVPEGRRILLFSSFTSMLELIEQRLTENNYEYVKLTGQTKDRATPINQFQSGNIPIMLLSLKAGGTGLNLTAADTVIHYDPWWNPAAEAQATDRAHRIGQHKPVFVYKLVCQGTVEEKILEMQKNKKRLMEGLFNAQEGRTTKLSSKDLAFLFEPLAAE